MEVYFVQALFVHLLVYSVVSSPHSQENLNEALSAGPTCGLPPLLDNSRTNQSRGETQFSLGYVIQYSCSVGFQKSGSSQGQYATCKIVGRDTAAWEGPIITCDMVTCKDPGHVANSFRTLASTKYGSSVTFTCKTGYSISGLGQRICQADGQWSGIQPQCNIVRCEIPESPESGSALYSSVTFGSEVRYECRNMRRVEGNLRRTCMATGQWNGTTPSCVVVDCGHPPNNFISGRFKFNSTRMGSAVEYQCDSESKPSRSVCLYTGVWHPPPPPCMYIPPTTMKPEPKTPPQSECNKWYKCMFRKFRNLVCKGLQKIRIRVCEPKDLN